MTKLIQVLLIPLVLGADIRGKLHDHMDEGVLDADDFDELEHLSEPEKRDKLLEICKKIDINSDKAIDKDELFRWIDKTTMVSFSNLSFFLLCLGD